MGHDSILGQTIMDPREPHFGRPGPGTNAAPAVSKPPWALWGSELSPFALKLEALLRWCSVPFEWQPRQGPFRRAVELGLRRHRLVTGRLPLTWPRMTALDELPLVPFLFGPDGENLYDSSAIGEWLANRQEVFPGARSLLPEWDPALRFVVRLVDEALDEIGLYLVHHHRWVVSARDNDAGRRLAEELRPMLGPLAYSYCLLFPARQVRRLPYLFSVAQVGPGHWQDLPGRLRPPSRQGFPPTHALLERLYHELLDAVESVLAHRPYLFGNAFTLADASLYGQLGMNRKDPSAWEILRSRAPATAEWVNAIGRGDLAHSNQPVVGLDPGIQPLLSWIARAFVPLMRQNHAAWLRLGKPIAARCNERAFDAGEMLYDGELLGFPFRSVVKTFQVQVWRDLEAAWGQLERDHRERVANLLPGEWPCPI